MLPITTRQFNRAVQIQVWFGDAKLHTTALYTQVNMKIGQSSSLYLVCSERAQRRLQDVRPGTGSSRFGGVVTPRYVLAPDVGA
jgi:hypothetical protein